MAAATRQGETQMIDVTIPYQWPNGWPRIELTKEEKAKMPEEVFSCEHQYVSISLFRIRDLASWYEDEANRRRLGSSIINQDALDRDLRLRLAEHGVFPEFIPTEFERVMQIVFPGSPKRMVGFSKSEAWLDFIVELYE